MVILGDHQPPALVSGEGASWDVPVHVVERARGRPRLACARKASATGSSPRIRPLARMDTLMRVLLDAFGNPVRSGLISERPAQQ